MVVQELIINKFLVKNENSLTMNCDVVVEHFCHTFHIILETVYILGVLRFIGSTQWRLNGKLVFFKHRQ